MKIAIVVAASAVALMSGCATTSTTAPGASQAAWAYDDNVDYAKVDAIDRAAKAQGLLIRWINYPQKKPPSSAGVAPSRADPST